MTNNSSTGGYLSPTIATPLPGGLTLDQFLNTVIAGITGITGSLVRPRFQANPPKFPDISVNWVAFQRLNIVADANAYVGETTDTSSVLHRNETFDVFCSFYGPDAEFLAGAFRDGFQISQNREAMFLAHMGFKGDGPIIPADELINDRFFTRRDITVTLARQIQPSYEILFFESVGGGIVTDNTPPLTAEIDSNDSTLGGFSAGYDQPQFG